MKKFLSIFLCIAVLLSFATIGASAATDDGVETVAAVAQEDEGGSETDVKVVDLFANLLSLVDWSAIIAILVQTVTTIISMFSGIGGTTTAAA